MTKFLVEAYRIALGILLVCGLLATLAIMNQFGGFGAVVWIFVLTLTLGVSAVLLAIYDNLEVLRKRLAPGPEDEARPAEGDANMRQLWIGCGVIIAIIVILFLAMRPSPDSASLNSAYADNMTEQDYLNSLADNLEAAADNATK